MGASDLNSHPSLTKTQTRYIMMHNIIYYYIEHGWDLTLKSIFPDESDLDRAEVLDFGVGHDNLMNILYQRGSVIPDKGIRALAKVLHAARESLGLEFCPLLPDLTCLLLSYMPVSSCSIFFVYFLYICRSACFIGSHESRSTYF